jgi:predicted dehydrogenase
MRGTMSHPLRVGLVGYGHGGAIFHAPLIRATDGLALAAIVTNDPERRQRVAADHPGVHLASGVAELLDGAGRVDVLVIASPNRWHVAHAMAALDAGTDVVVDKPLAATATAARALVAKAEASGRLLTVFQNRRWDGDILTVRRLLHEGRLGTIHRFESRFERWRPVPRTTWRERGAPEDAGGLLYDLGSHLIDQALLLFGPVTRVWAEVDLRRTDAVVDDDVFVALEHAGGVRSHIWTSQLAASSGPRFVVRGNVGSYVKWGLDVQEEALKRGERPGAGTWGAEAREAWGQVHDGTSSRAVETERGDYGAFYRQLVAAVRGEGPVPVDPRDAVRTLDVIEAARRSSLERRVVEIEA